MNCIRKFNNYIVSIQKKRELKKMLKDFREERSYKIEIKILIFLIGLSHLLLSSILLILFIKQIKK